MSTLPAATDDDGPPEREPCLDATRARDFILALGRVYLEAGLPLYAAIEAALADYQHIGADSVCEFLAA
jgi:hypothetical protein